VSNRRDCDCVCVCGDASLWQCVAFWWNSLYVLQPSDPARPVLDHCCCKDASLHSPRRQPGTVFFPLWHLPSCPPAILYPCNNFYFTLASFCRKMFEWMFSHFLRDLKTCKHIFWAACTSLLSFGRHVFGCMSKYLSQGKTLINRSIHIYWSKRIRVLVLVNSTKYF